MVSQGGKSVLRNRCNIRTIHFYLTREFFHYLGIAVAGHRTDEVARKRSTAVELYPVLFIPVPCRLDIGVAFAQLDSPLRIGLENDTVRRFKLYAGKNAAADSYQQIILAKGHILGCSGQ